jgi:hypothetical protein
MSRHRKAITNDLTIMRKRKLMNCAPVGTPYAITLASIEIGTVNNSPQTTNHILPILYLLRGSSAMEIGSGKFVGTGTIGLTA